MDKSTEEFGLLLQWQDAIYDEALTAAKKPPPPTCRCGHSQTAHKTDGKGGCMILVDGRPCKCRRFRLR